MFGIMGILLFRLASGQPAPEAGADAEVESATTGEQRALIIGIGDYKHARWTDLLGPVNDVGLIQESLVKSGFSEQKIAVLRDKEATKKGIIQALDRLVEQTSAGDTVVVHYSGHGYQTADDNGDEQDGIDELVVPHDAGDPLKKKLQGYIRDDLLGDKLTAIRKRAGPDGHVLFLLDACHSGTMTRSAGLGMVRSIGSSMAKFAVQNAEAIEKTGQDFASGKNLASFVVISAARYDEEAAEVTLGKDGPSYGSLSVAFKWAVNKLNADGMSYRAFHNLLKIRIAQLLRDHQQVPQMEGNLDVDVLKGTVFSTGSGVRIRKVVDKQHIEIAAGLLQGVGKASKVGVFPLRVGDPKDGKPLVMGEVVNAHGDYAEVRLNTPYAVDRENSWAHVTEADLGPNRLPIALDKQSRFPRSLKKALQADSPDWVVVDSGAVLVLKMVGKEVCLDDGSHPNICDRRSYPAGEVLTRLRLRSWGDFIRYYDRVDESTVVDLEFRFPDDGEGEDAEWSRCATAEGRVPCGEGVESLRHVKIKGDETFRIVVTNKDAKTPMHFTVTAVDEDYGVSGVNGRIYSVGPAVERYGDTSKEALPPNQSKAMEDLDACGSKADRTTYRLVASSASNSDWLPTFDALAKKATEAEENLQKDLAPCVGTKSECPGGQKEPIARRSHAPTWMSTAAISMELETDAKLCSGESE